MEKINSCVILSLMETELRKSYRHPIRVPIQLTTVDETKATSQCEDLSQGGLSFYWPDSIPQGTLLRLSIPVEKQLYKMSAHVTYSQKDETTGLFKTGVCFEDSTHAFRTQLAEEILQIRAYREKMTLLRGNRLSEKEASDLWLSRHAENFTKLFG